ncbi:endothiapepsin precursor [Cordyceps fumosorosea ARSEF 2679]|uniref:Endothiapepsin n=1 Tax=Cordyceps fumosorosea (strain ARSEF 2679) TaxID=1081104 RepID=A0A162LLC1_CORFA|nr:endothiapepsin precursor [Cordyceps fumosorosea ARSEF 2679]OAA72294.1 endothiapepsin precursor [Cordyceps fumosorosea ARSEF 2679]
MKTTTTIIAALALAATGHSAAQWRASFDSSSAGGHEEFSLEQIRNEKFKGVDPVDAILQAYARYATFIPARIQAVIDRTPEVKLKFPVLDSADPSVVRAEASPPADFDSEYALPVSLGTPPQVLPLNLDTGSSDLWVFSTDTPPQSLNGQKLYYPRNSSTSEPLQGATWKIKYGDNSTASGIVYLDRAAIGPVGYDKQAIEVAQAVSSAIAQDNFISGILGMASSAANTVTPNKQLTFLDNILSKLKRPLFTANLQKARPGNYNFGYINESEYTGNVAYTPIDPNTPYWMVNLSGYQLGGSNGSAFSNMTIRGIVDTGTSLLLLPQDVVDAYYAKVPGSRLDARLANVVFPCNATLPNFVFGVGDGYRGIVPGSYINYGRVSNRECFGGLQSSTGIPFSVFGDVLLKAQFVVFDRGTLRVGFANKPTV